MSQKLMLGWALSATLIAVGAVGYIAGKNAGRPTPVMSAPAATSTDPTSDRSTDMPVYRVPESLQGIPTEWRTVVDDTPVGVAALFDPTSRRFVAERCEHHAYATTDTALELNCETLLSGQLASLAVTEATVFDRDGTPATVRLDLDHGAQPPQLRLRFGEHDARLIPGRRNDLVQAMEALPIVQKNRRAYLLAMAGPRPESNRASTATDQ